MKHGIRKHIARILLVTVMASIIFIGAITRSFADQPSSYSEIYWGDIKEYVESLTPSNTNSWSYYCNQFFSYADDFIGEYEGPDPLVYCLWDSDGSILLGVFSGNNQSNTGNYFAFNWLNYSTLTTDNQTVDRSVSIRMILYYNNSSNSGYLVQSGLPSSGVGMRATAAFNFSSPIYADSIPSVYNFNVSGRKIYVSRDIVSANKNFESYIGPDWGMYQNISATPLVGSFEMTKFYLGSSAYIAIKDQSIMANFYPVEGYFYYLTYDVSIDNQDPIHSFAGLASFTRLDSSVSMFVPDVYDYNYWIYALNFEDVLNESVYVKMDNFKIYSHDESEGGAIITNLVYESSSVLEWNSPNQPKEPDPKESAWEKMAEFLDNYNTNHVVPENLPEYFFGENGGKLYPCSIQMSSLIYGSNNQGNPATPGINTISWGFGPSFNGSMYNFDLMDVVIVPNNGTVFSIRYFYDDLLGNGSLSGTYTYVDLFDYNNLLSQFDIILIVPNDIGILHELTGNSGMAPIGYTGSGSEGIQYTSDALIYNKLDGFAFITQRAIQKQQLYNFNNGIDKLYKLEVDYIESEDLWKDSFLLWSASIFDMLNSLDGRLGRIGDILDSIAAWNVGDFMADIVGSLERIAENTSENDTHGHWYQSIWDFISQFLPTDSQFSNGLQSIYDISDDIPALPTISPVLTLPPLPGGN